jgi:Domain of unknown function (DUF4410)
MRGIDQQKGSTDMTRLLVLLTVSASLVGCGSAKISAERQLGAGPTATPRIVYVADFELDGSNVHAQRGLFPPPPLPGLGNVLPKLPGTPQEPAVRARQLVELMATSLVKELTDKGATAQRLGKHAPPPSDGWLLRGVFTDVQEGNQFHRAVVGFGMGQTELQVVVAVDDLTRGTPRPLYEVDTKGDSGTLPGAAITLNPYVAAARFLLSAKDLDRNVKQTATRIAEQVTGRIEQSRNVVTRQ